MSTLRAPDVTAHGRFSNVVLKNRAAGLGEKRNTGRHAKDFVFVLDDVAGGTPCSPFANYGFSPLTACLGKSGVGYGIDAMAKITMYGLGVQSDERQTCRFGQFGPWTLDLISDLSEGESEESADIDTQVPSVIIVLGQNTNAELEEVMSFEERRRVSSSLVAKAMEVVKARQDRPGQASPEEWAKKLAKDFFDSGANNG